MSQFLFRLHQRFLRARPCSSARTQSLESFKCLPSYLQIPRTNSPRLPVPLSPSLSHSTFFLHRKEAIHTAIDETSAATPLPRTTPIERAILSSSPSLPERLPPRILLTCVHSSSMHPSFAKRSYSATTISLSLSLSHRGGHELARNCGSARAHLRKIGRAHV